MLSIEWLKRPDKQWVVVALLVWRMTLGFLVKTSFVPDEYYQVVETAFGQSSGNGIVTWEWERAFQIRSFVSILPFIAIFKAIAWTIDSAFWQAIVPRLVQSLLAFVADVCLYDLVSALQDDQVATIVAIVHCLSWSTAYCLCRTLANSTETCLIIIGTSLLITSRCKSHCTLQRTAAIVIAGISTYVRPTSVLVWAPLFLGEIASRKDPFSFIIRQCVPWSVFVLESCILVDSYFYGSFTVSPLNFYSANISHNMASLFGVHPWHWNLTQGLPVMLGLYTPLLVYGLLLLPPSYYKQQQLHPTVIWLSLLSGVYVVGLSAISPHQEIRFLLPCLPFLHILVGNVVLRLLDIEADVTGRTQSNKSGVKFRYFSMGRIVCAVIAAVHLGCIFYLLRYHQSGTEAAMLFIANDIKTSSRATNSAVATVVTVLAPCYSFPGYSFVHTQQYPVVLNMLSCDPRNRSNSFDSNPVHHLHSLLLSNNHYNLNTSSSSYVLTFDAYLPLLSEPLKDLHYSEVRSIRHAYFRYDYDDPYPKQTVHIYKKLR